MTSPEILYDAAIGAAAAFSLILIADSTIRRAPARHRASMFLVALVLGLAAPILVRWVPSVLQLISPAMASRVEQRWHETTTRESVHLKLPAREIDAPSSVATIDQHIAAVAAPHGAGDWFVGIWAIGSGVGLLFYSHLLLAAARIVKRGIPVQDADWIARAARAATTLGVRRRVVLIESSDVSMPAVLGLRRAVVIIPHHALAWSESRRELVLQHELAHIQRCDILSQSLAHLVVVLYWFNPLVWLATARFRRIRERACDEHVLAAGFDPVAYGTDLLDIVREQRRQSVPLLAVAMAKVSELEGRVLAILEHQPRGAQRVSAAVIVFLIVPTLLAAIAMKPFAVARDVRQPTRIGGGTGSAYATTLGRDTIMLPLVRKGRWLEVVSERGEIRAYATRDANPRIALLPHGEGLRRIRWIVSDSGDIQLCIVRTGDDDSAPTCDLHVNEKLLDGPVTDIEVYVPTGIAFAGHAGEGGVSTRRLDGPVWATTLRGNLHLESSDVVEASTENGDISAVMGARAWKQNVEFFARGGNIHLQLARDVSTWVHVNSGVAPVRMDSVIRSARWTRRGAEVAATLGAGNANGVLTVRAPTGHVSITSSR